MSDSPIDPRPADVLPVERAPALRGGALAWFVALAVASVVLANVGVAEFLKRVPVNGGYALALGKWTLMDRALAEGRPVDVLIVGDSSANQGLNPAVIEERTGQRAMNFGVIADARPVSCLWFVRRWLEQTARHSGPQPKAILWMHAYDAWSRADPGQRRLMGIAAALPTTAWPQIVRPPNVRFTLDELRWRRLFPLWWQNASVQLLIRRPIDSLAQVRGVHFDADGFTAETVPNLEQVSRDTHNHRSIVRESASLLPNSFSRETIGEMAKLADRYGVDVWIVEGPINASLWHDDVFRERWFEVHNALRREARRTNRVRMTFDEPMRFADGRMQNCDHVCADAAADFTDAVIDRITASPAANVRAAHR